jgi:DHA1 family bicyclomycin/chloramphenicol resistance-like MFS transporter
MSKNALQQVPAGTVILAGVLSALAPISTDMYLPALPTLTNIFGTPAEPTLGAFLVGVAISQFIYGPWSDRVGRKRPMIVGLLLYIIGTLACAFMSTLSTMIAARFVQAMGAGAGGVLARASIRDRFDDRSSARALSLLSMVTGLGPILAPIIGASLVGLGWRSIFMLQAGIGALVLWAVCVGFSETHAGEKAAFSREETVLSSFAHLLRDRRIIGFTLAGAFNGAAIFAYVASASHVFIGVYNATPLQFAWVFGINAVGLVAAGQLNAQLLKWYRPDQILLWARPVTIIFALSLVAVVSADAGMWAMLLPLFLVVASFGVIGPNTLACSMGLDTRRTGSISSLMGAATFGASAIMTMLVATVQGDSARPLAWLVLGSIILSSLALYVLARPARPDARDALEVI